jgi:rhodanese-related sulfurtransferase
MPTSMATCQGRRQINARSQSAHVALARDGITGLKVLRRSALRSGRFCTSLCATLYASGFAWLLLCFSTACHASSLDQIEADIAAASPVAQLSSTEVTALLAVPQGVVLFDVRDPEEFAVSHLPGAIRIDPNLEPAAFIQAYGHVFGQQPVVFYCSVGRRSTALAERVNALSATQAPSTTPVANLRGGIFRWANEARPLQNARGETKLVHPYSFYWARLLTDKKQISYAPQN